MTITELLEIVTTLVVTEPVPPELDTEIKSPTFKLVVQLQPVLPMRVLAIRVLAIAP